MWNVFVKETTFFLSILSLFCKIMDWMYACIDEPGEDIRDRAFKIYSCIYNERQITGSLNICPNQKLCETQALKN